MGKFGEELVGFWLTKKCEELESNLDCVKFEDFGELAIASDELAVWHPLNDLSTAPRIAFGSTPHVQAVWEQKELVGYVLSTKGDIVRWCEIGDASTDTDRFFLVPADQVEAADDWFNEDPLAFEELGGESLVQLVERAGGTKIVVLTSYDGNARVQAGVNESGLAICAIIET